MSSNPQSQVRKRRVFYIPGYDPIHPRRYRELYRTESRAQAEISKYVVSLSPKQTKGGAYGWHVDGAIEGGHTQADFEVLVWSDIVRDSMAQGIAQTYVQLVRTAWTYIASGTLRRLMWLRKGPVIAALYPVGFLLVQLIAALLVWWAVSAAVGGALSAALGLVLEEARFPRVFGILGWIGTFAGFAAFVYLLRWFKAKDGKFFAYYLMHDYAYSARTGGANSPELEARMAEFGDVIAAALEKDVDEVLVVGHSSGAHLAVSILADLIRAGRVRMGGPELSFLSLGQVVPMVSFLPKAYRLREDLHYLCQRDELFWLDVTAPGDGCAFALCDPVTVSGVAPDQGKQWPLVISASFTQTLSEERWKELRWKFFRLHFQYLCAFDRPKDYDYFRITAGPISLGTRYLGRPPSKSRIDVPASKYTSRSP